MAIRLSGNALVVGMKMVRLLNGKPVTIVTDSSGQVYVDSGGQPSSSLKAWRTSWWEIPTKSEPRVNGAATAPR